MTFYPDPALREPRRATPRAGAKARIGVPLLLASAVAGALALLVLMVNIVSVVPNDRAILVAMFLLVLWAGLGIVGWAYLGSSLTIYLDRDDERRSED